VEIEAQVLGAMLLEREAIPRVIEVLDEDAFHAEYHRKIFKAILTMFDRSEPVDIITLAEELRRRGELEVVGGEAYLAELTMKVSSPANAEYHAKIILEKYLQRSLISAASTIAARGYNPSEDAFELLDEAEQMIFHISEKRLKKTFTQMHKAVHDTSRLCKHCTANTAASRAYRPASAISTRLQVVCRIRT
jgi:replicative DNA helicase